MTNERERFAHFQKMVAESTDKPWIRQQLGPIEDPSLKSGSGWIGLAFLGLIIAIIFSPILKACGA